MERCNCNSQQGGDGLRLAAIVRGNDFTVEAHASVYDQDKGIYIPFDLSAATDVTISAVGRYTKAEGAAVAVSGNKVTVRFSGALAEGLYGVEILFRDSAGRGRIFERDLFAIVGDSSEATAGTVSEGGSGDGLDISVDVRSRVVRIGRTAMVSDYKALSNKPSIGGVELDGDKTPAELGLAEKGDIPASMSQLENDEGFVKAQEVSALLGGKVDKVDGKGLSTNDYTDADKVKVGKALTEHQSLGNYYTKEETNTKLGGYAPVYDCSWILNNPVGSTITDEEYNGAVTVLSKGYLFQLRKGLYKVPVLVGLNGEDKNNPILYFVFLDEYGAIRTIEIRKASASDSPVIHSDTVFDYYTVESKQDKPFIITGFRSVSVSGEYPKLYSGTSLTSVTITAAKTDSSQNGVEEVFQFSTGASPAITITGVSWANSDAPTFEANKTYEIHIMYNSTLDKFLATYAVYE